MPSRRTASPPLATSCHGFNEEGFSGASHAADKVFQGLQVAAAALAFLVQLLVQKHRLDVLKDPALVAVEHLIQGHAVADV